MIIIIVTIYKRSFSSLCVISSINVCHMCLDVQCVLMCNQL